MGVGVTRLAALVVLLGLWAWSSQAQPQGSAAAPAASLTAVTTDDGGDWLPALVPAPALPTALVVFTTVVGLPLLWPVPYVRIRTTRSRAPPAG